MFYNSIFYYTISFDVSIREYNRIVNSLPTEMTLDVTVESNQDEDEVIADEITYNTDWLVNNFNYMIIEEK